MRSTVGNLDICCSSDEDNVQDCPNGAAYGNPCKFLLNESTFTYIFIF